MNVHAASLTTASLTAMPVPAVPSPAVARIPPDPSLPPGQRDWHERLPRRDYVELAADLAAVPSARHLLRADLREWGLHALLDDAELVTTEIVANAVNVIRAERWPASRPPVRMWVRGGWARGSGTLVILVWDACATVPVTGSPEALDESGRGLLLIGACSRWGYYHPPGEHAGKVIWAELPKPLDQGTARTA